MFVGLGFFFFVFGCVFVCLLVLGFFGEDCFLGLGGFFGCVFCFWCLGLRGDLREVFVGGAFLGGFLLLKFGGTHPLQFNLKPHPYQTKSSLKPS